MRLACAAAAMAVAMVACGLAAARGAPSKSACGPAETRALVSRFVRAFNSGDRRALDAAWASRLWFRWFAVSGQPGARPFEDAVRRDLLLPYFAARHAVHERWALTGLKLNGVTGGGYWNFEFRLARSADDLPGEPVAYVGKGASTCSTGRLFVWGMGPAR